MFLLEFQKLLYITNIYIRRTFSLHVNKHYDIIYFVFVFFSFYVSIYIHIYLCKLYIFCPKTLDSRVMLRCLMMIYF